MKTMKAQYRSSSERKSSIKLDAQEIPIELHQMIVWVMLHQEDAMHLLPEYQKLRQQATYRDEAQKTHCGQDI